MSTTNIAVISGNTITDHKTLDALIDRYKALRLRALKDDPQAFGSKYEDELKFPRERWQARIQNPSATTFIALDDTAEVGTVSKSADDGDITLPRLLTSKWLGTLTMVGPEVVPDLNIGAKELLNLFDSKRANLPDRERKGPLVAYMLNGMYVVSEGRNRRNGRRLVAQAIEYARKKGGEEAHAAQVWVLAFVEVANVSAFEFYRKGGFQAWDEEVLLGDRYVRMLAFKGAI